MFLLERTFVRDAVFIRRKMSQMVHLSVEPKWSLVDERLATTKISGLESNSTVNLRLSVTNKSNLDYESVTQFKADSLGNVDVNSDLPVCESYRNPDLMAIYWTMIPREKSDKRFWAMNVEQGLTCTYEVSNENGEVLAKETIARDFMRPGVRRIEIEDGSVRGSLFLPKGSGPFPCIINMYGGIHRGSAIEEKSAVFASRGFASLSLAFFGVKDLPKTYSDKPLNLDYFEEAVDVMLKREDIQCVGAAGLSKAGEISLLMSTCMPTSKLKAVAALNATTNVYIIPAVHKGKIFQEETKVALDASKFKEIGPDLFDLSGLLTEYREQAQSLIPFAQTSTPTLFIAGEDDRLFNAKDNAEYARELMGKSEKTDWEVHTIPGLGHLIDLPFSPPTTVSNHALLPKNLSIVLGGDNLELHGKGQESAWKVMLNFFAKYLASTSKL